MTLVMYHKIASHCRLVYLFLIVLLFFAYFSYCCSPFFCYLFQFPCRRFAGLSRSTKLLCLETYRTAENLKQFGSDTLNVGQIQSIKTQELEQAVASTSREQPFSLEGHIERNSVCGPHYKQCLYSCLFIINNNNNNNNIQSEVPILGWLNLFENNLNPLNTKRRLLYLKTQFVPRSKHFSSRL